MKQGYTPSGKVDLVLQLREAYKSDRLPDAKNTVGFMRESTNTWFCKGSTEAEEMEVNMAIAYFEKAANEFLSGTLDDDHIQKAKYCKMAAEAIQFAKEHKKN